MTKIAALILLIAACGGQDPATICNPAQAVSLEPPRSCATAADCYVGENCGDPEHGLPSGVCVLKCLTHNEEDKNAE